MWLIVGLGNPGPRYERNRHNLGFRVVDEVARRHRIAAFHDKFGGEAASGSLDGDRVVLLKPMQFMNVSGIPVQRAAQFHKVAPDAILVVHDEVDFPFGRVRVKQDGGHGGHNGLRSIIEQLGDRFARVRCGVGRPLREDGAPADEDRVANYVLSDFPAAQTREVDDIVGRAADAVEAVVARGIVRAMNEVNGQNGQEGSS